MGQVMTAQDFISKAKNIATRYKTLYVMGCFGAPMTPKNKKRYCNNNAYNKRAERTKMIMDASSDTYGFDCVCLIKGILWGWDGDISKTYGGARYASNGVPDIGADAMIKYCHDVSAGDWPDMAPGEVVWMSGHIGIYIGGGLAVECSPAWKNKVQITEVKNINPQSGDSSRIWQKHGKLPWIKYETAPLTPLQILLNMVKRALLALIAAFQKHRARR